VLDERRVPLLGVMGAFVFAAQMVNFPVGIGTSGHLVGGALLAATVGPAPAAIVMTAIVAVQALVFGDGGILALGANVFNMALAGVVAGYAPVAWLGRGTAAVFLGGFLSVCLSAALAISELWLSGVMLPGAVLGLSALLFLVSAAAEGAITVLALRAIERLKLAPTANATATHQRQSLATLGLAALALVAGGVLVASALPDGLASLAQQAGFARNERVLVNTPFTGYETSWLSGAWAGQAMAGMVGLGLVFVLAVSLARLLGRRNQAG
jgi:cobalt/nickel transport system permease protein